MSDRLDVYEDVSGEWRWRLIAGNGEVIAEGEGHTRREDAERAGQRVIDSGNEDEA